MALRPLIQVIDDWATNRRLALAFEAQVGPGRLLACSINLDTDLTTNPVARQLRASLLAYAASDAFTPAHEVPPADLSTLLRGNGGFPT